MISVVINYCSNEKMFINPLLTECSKFSDDIVVSYGDHLYNGILEDMDHIHSLKIQYPYIQFVSYEVNLSLDLTKQKGVINRPTAFWHNRARWTGVKALKNKGWTFIIDADEIPEGRMVNDWLEKALLLLKDNECYKISTFWYFKDPTNQATTLEDSILLIHYKYLTEDNIFGDLERDYLIPASKCNLIRGVKGLNNAILWHHYSFVRTKEGLAHKLKNWGHNTDMFKNVNVDEIIKHIYHNDEVNDIVHCYNYNKVYNKFNIKVNS